MYVCMSVCMYVCMYIGDRSNGGKLWSGCWWKLRTVTTSSLERFDVLRPAVSRLSHTPCIYLTVYHALENIVCGFKVSRCGSMVMYGVVMYGLKGWD